MLSTGLRMRASSSSGTGRPIFGRSATSRSDALDKIDYSEQQRASSRLCSMTKAQCVVSRLWLFRKARSPRYYRLREVAGQVRTGERRQRQRAA